MAGALPLLRRSLARSAPTDSITRKLFALIARSHQMLGDGPAALRACGEGLSVDPDDAELWFRKAVVHRHRCEPGEAEQCWRRILTLRRPDQFCSVDQGIYGHLTRRNLAALAVERGDAREAARLWAEVLRECPGDREALAALERYRTNPRPRPQATGPPGQGPWLVAGSQRRVVPDPGTTDFGPYAELAKEWIITLQAKVILELGVRFGDASRALLAGAHAIDGHIWGVDPLVRHDVLDPRFTFLESSPLDVRRPLGTD